MRQPTISAISAFFIVSCWCVALTFMWQRVLVPTCSSGAHRRSCRELAIATSDTRRERTNLKRSDLGGRSATKIPLTMPVRRAVLDPRLAADRRVASLISGG
jgi:hypothetical protein